MVMVPVASSWDTDNPENDSSDEQKRPFICNGASSSPIGRGSRVGGGGGAFLQRTSIRKSLRRLESSSRLVSVCSGSDLTQLYLSSPEEVNPLANSTSFSSGIGQSIDMYGRRKSFRRLSSYAIILDDDCGLGTLRESSMREDRAVSAKAM